MVIRREYERVRSEQRKCIISKSLKSKVCPKTLADPTGESAYILFYIWNTESDKGCLLNLAKSQLQFYLLEV